MKFKNLTIYLFTLMLLIPVFPVLTNAENTQNSQITKQSFNDISPPKIIQARIVNDRYPQMQKPQVDAYLNKDDLSKGYLNVSWEPLDGVSKYQVILFNGSVHSYWDVPANTTVFTTQGKGMYQTEDQINSGQVNYRRDGKGTDFSVNPSNLYSKAFEVNGGLNYTDSTNFHVRVTAVFEDSASPISYATVVSFPKPVYLTEKEYEEYLMNYNINDAFNQGIEDYDTAKQSVIESESNLETYQALSSEEKAKLISLFNNYDKMDAIYNNDLDVLGEDSSLVSWEKDENTFEDLQPFATSGSRTISHVDTLKLAGVKITKYKISGKYGYNSSGVNNHYETYGNVEYNFNPTVDTDLTYYNGYIKSGKYYGKVIFSYKIGLFDYGVARIGTMYMELCGSKSGIEWGMMYRK